MDRERIKATKKYLELRMEILDPENIEGKIRLCEEDTVMKIMKDDLWFRETLQQLYEKRRKEK